ncbi:MAG: hypothetical protein ACREN4_09525 [Candidatus Dormibacteria bacterium]
MSRPRLEGAAEQGGLLALAALLLFVDLFLPWFRGFHAFVVCPYNSACSFGQSNGWGGAGTVAGVLAGLLALWEALRVARVRLGVVEPYRSLLSAGLCLLVLIFGVIDVAANLTWMSPAPGTGWLYGGLFIWIALFLALVIGLVGLVHWGIWQRTAPAGPAPHPGAPPAAGLACPTCGRVSAPSAVFCAQCGTRLQSAPAARRPRTPPAPQ